MLLQAMGLQRVGNDEQLNHSKMLVYVKITMYVAHFINLCL